jgi:hypothetical protein
MDTELVLEGFEVLPDRLLQLVDSDRAQGLRRAARIRGRINRSVLSELCIIGEINGPSVLRVTDKH